MKVECPTRHPLQNNTLSPKLKPSQRQREASPRIFSYVACPGTGKKYLWVVRMDVKGVQVVVDEERFFHLLVAQESQGYLA